MDIEELSNILRNDNRELTEFICDIDAVTPTEKNIVAALYAINYKVESLNLMMSQLMQLNNPMQKLSSDLNGVTQQLADSNNCLNNIVKEIINRKDI